jgi:predicted transposase YbfD/YdcC
MDRRLTKRVAGMLRKRLPEAVFEDVQDPRSHRGRRRELGPMLRGVVVGILAGCKSLLELEALTEEMAPRTRRALGIEGRLPDTTARDVLCRLCPDSLRQALYRIVQKAHRRKALQPEGLPFGVVALDGKTTALPCWSGEYAQYQSHSQGTSAHGALRTMTATLVSASARPCIDAMPILASTNEMGAFSQGLRELLAAYPKRSGLFQLITYDAGACSLENASLVVNQELDYLFALKGTQPTILTEARRILAGRDKPDATTEDVNGDGTVVRRVFVSEAVEGFLDWGHLQTFLRIDSERFDKRGQRISIESRYFLSSLRPNRLTPKQWMQVIRAHWGVENNCHHTLDAVFREDTKPWILYDPAGTLALMLLRRIACTLLALFRSVTQRAEDTRKTPWRDLIRAIYHALLLGDLPDEALPNRDARAFATP